MSPKQLNLSITAELDAAAKALAPALKRLSKILAAIDLAAMPNGALADTLYDLIQVKSQLAHLTDPFDDVLPPKVKEIEDYFKDSLAVGESSGLQGMHSRVQVTESPKPNVTNWPEFYKYVARTKSWELLNKALNIEAFKERWADKKQVPHTDVFRVKRVSCTKLSGKGR